MSHENGPGHGLETFTYDRNMVPVKLPRWRSALIIAFSTAVVSLALLALTASLFSHDPSLHDEPMSDADWIATGATLVVQALALVLRARWPVASMLLIAVLPLGLASVQPSSAFTLTVLPIIVSVFLTGLSNTVSRLSLWALLTAVIVASGQWVNSLGAGEENMIASAFGALGQAAIVVLLPLMPAVFIASQRALSAAQRETVNALTRERDAQIGEALARERSTMARELHDIAAHHLSGISLMAGAIARQIGTDPEVARDGALQIREQSRAILDDLRRLVGLLRDDDDQGLKTLATIADLVTAVRSSGAEVELQIQAGEGTDPGRRVGPLAQLAGYRMVQESLTNALRHAPGSSCTVVIDGADPEALHLTVCNTARDSTGEAQTTRSGETHTSGSGLGILGMVERAALIGGTCEAGPDENGGWVVQMTIPRDPDRGIS